MSEAIPITIPLINPNEPEAMLAGLFVSNGQHVQPGDLICTLETTKSAQDLHAESEGFIAGLQSTPGDSLQAGETLCYLAPSPDWVAPQPGPLSGSHASENPDSSLAPPPGLRITQPALELASRFKLDLSQFPGDRLVTESMVRERLGRTRSAPDFSIPEIAFDPTTLLIYGGGGHGKKLIDLVRSLGAYHLIGIVDDGLPVGAEVLGAPVLGGKEILQELYARGVRMAVNGVGGIGNVAVRVKVYRQLASAGFVFPAVIHPTARREYTAYLAPAAQVFPNAYIGLDARIGFGAIVNTGAIVSHDCQVGDYAAISPGAILAGMVQVGPGALIGMGVTVNFQIKIGSGARIGNGATIKGDVPEGAVVKAGRIWPD